MRGARIWAWWTVAGLAVLGPLTAYLLLGYAASRSSAR